MKIRAIRLADVGPFRAGVALEGLSGGLDVLTGPNEFGKSTIFAALSRLLSEKHTTTAREVAALRPDAGGAPLIEADFEVAGRRLRLRKRFLAKRMARLVDLDTRQIWHDADAEAAADSLLGGDARRAMRGLLWVQQGASFALPEKPDASLAACLASLVEREAADAAGAGDIRRVAGEVQARLSQLVSSRGPKAGGPLDTCVKRRDAIAHRLAAARALAQSAAARSRRLVELRAEIADLADPARAQSLADRAGVARKALDDAERARERLRAVSERVDARLRAHEHAKLAQTAFARLSLEAGQVAASTAEYLRRLEALGRARATGQTGLAAAQERHAALEAAIKARRRQLQRANAAVARQAAENEVERLDQLLATARSARVAIATIEAELAAAEVSEPAVKAARALASRHAALEAQVMAEAPSAVIAYLPSGAARIRIAGRIVGDGECIVIERPTELEIEGVGTLSIAPSASGGRSAVGERDSCGTELARALQAMGVADLAGAEAALEQRRGRESALAAQQVRLTSAAPLGLERLEAEHAVAAGRCLGAVAEEALDGETEPSRIEQHIGTLEGAAEIAAKEAERLALDLQSVTEDIARTEARLAAERRRAAEIEQELPAVAERDATRERLVATEAAAAEAVGEAVRERAAWAAAVPQANEHEAILAAVRSAEQALVETAQRKASLDRELAEIEGALGRDHEEGAGNDVAELEEELAVASARVADLELDAGALALLADRLAAIGAAHREHVLRPLVDRLRPMIGRILPGARLELDGPLTPARLERSERSEPPARLSGGTREQIATLVRIGYADLLAAQGMELPLVLDDALVFADDTRLAAMVDMLAEAARRHQVILLSCRQSALDPLIAATAACRLELTAWADQEGTERGAWPAGLTAAKDRAASPASILVG